MEINILFEIDDAANLLPESWLKNVIETVLTAEQSGPDAEVSLVIAGQQQVQDLNRTYLGEDHPTDVLSFPMLPPTGETAGFMTPPDGLKHLGEIIISLPQAATQAAEHGHSTEREISILLIHGVLHLLGYDHDIPEAETRMKERETCILEMLAN